MSGVEQFCVSCGFGEYITEWTIVTNLEQITRIILFADIRLFL